MKIAVMVRGFIPTPRPADIVYIIIDLAAAIAEGLAQRGHKVDFYGPTGTKLNIPLITSGLRSLVNNESDMLRLCESTDLLTHYVPGLWDNYLATEMFQRATEGEYDILHFHHPESSIAISRLFPDVPVVYTLHDALSDWHQEILKLFSAPNQSYIAISDRQRRLLPDLPYKATIYNGINPSKFPFCDEPEDYLLFVGRMVPKKGVKEAVEVARLTGKRLLLVGPLLPDSKAYFDKHVKPYLNDKIRYIGYVEYGPKLAKYFQHAKALLMPIKWEEPFGMVMAEAMSCGTPVIAFKRGSAPEIIEDKKTGFVVETVQQMAAAVKKIDQIKRADCRKRVLEHFSIDCMVDGYESVFQKIIAES